MPLVTVNWGVFTSCSGSFGQGLCCVHEGHLIWFHEWLVSRGGFLRTLHLLPMSPMKRYFSYDLS